MKYNLKSVNSQMSVKSFNKYLLEMAKITDSREIYRSFLFSLITKLLNDNNTYHINLLTSDNEDYYINDQDKNKNVLQLLNSFSEIETCNLYVGFNNDILLCQNYNNNDTFGIIPNIDTIKVNALYKEQDKITTYPMNLNRVDDVYEQIVSYYKFLEKLEKEIDLKFIGSGFCM